MAVADGYDFGRPAPDAVDDAVVADERLSNVIAVQLPYDGA